MRNIEHSMSYFEKWLKHTLELKLGGKVEDRILGKQNIELRLLDILADELVQDVYNSEEMSEFRESLLQCNQLLRLEENAIPDSCSALGWTTACRNSSGDGSPPNGGPDDFRFFAELKGKSVACRSARQRMHALELLLKVPISDIVCSANWLQLQKELCESLCDDNWGVFMQVLKVLARLASSVSFNPIREGFLSLLEGLTLYYLSRHLHQQLPNFLHGIQLENSVHRRIILISKCILQVLSEVPGKWIRFGEKRVQEIVDNLVDLLSMHTHHHRTLTDNQNKDVLYPFHIFAVLDPQAKWCKDIIHSAFGRNILLKCVFKSSSLIRFIVEEVIIWLESHIKLSDSATLVYELGLNGNVNRNMINLTVFIHCVSLIRMFVSCDKGHLMFPVLTSLQEDTVTVYSILIKLIEFLNRAANESTMRYSTKLLHVLENVCFSLLMSRGTHILHGKSSDLVHLLMEAPNKSDNYCLHFHNIRILREAAESHTAISWMVGRPARKGREGTGRHIPDIRLSLSSASSTGGRESVLTNRTTCVARNIAKATAVAVRDRDRLTSDATLPICQLLALCERLFSTPEGYLLLESCEEQLIPSAGNLLIHVRDMMYSSDPGLLSIQQSLENFLMGMTLMPLGFLAVSRVEGLTECLVASYVESPISEKYDEPRFLHLLHLSSLVPEINLKRYRKQLIKHAFNQLWTTQHENSESIWNEAINHFLKNILSICASPKIISELWEDDDRGDSSSESTLVEEIEPLSVRELLLSGLQSSNELSSIHIQQVFLTVLHSFAHNVDIALELQDKLKLTECLKEKLADAKLAESNHESTTQPSPRRAASAIFDEVALSCNHIITILNQLRDPSVFDFQSCSSSMSPRSHTGTGRTRVQTDLQRFLQDTRHGLHDNMWILHARRAYRTSCRSELKVSVLMDLLDQVLRSGTSPFPSEVTYRWPTSVQYQLHSNQHLQAINMIIRYGCHTKVLSSNMINLHVEQLSILLHQARTFLCLEEDTKHFDWFVCSIFLMCAGNIEKSRCLLQRVAMLPTGPYIWSLLAQNTLQLTSSINQQLQGLLIEYVPKAYNVLQEAGIPWWLVVERLTHQAFMPTMLLTQMPHLIALTALHSWEYNLYMRVAILSHVQSRILDMSLDRSVLALLLELRLENFYIGDYLPFMDRLAKLNRPNSTATL